MQYLVSQGTIKLPAQQVIATKSLVTDSDRAMSMVVNIKTSPVQKYYSFSALFVTSNIGPSSPFFQLNSLPSKDKKPYYAFVSKYVNPGSIPDPVDVDIDILAGDGTIIETLQYKQCKITAYWTDTNVDKNRYSFSKVDEFEFEDHTNFQCTGYSLKLP